MNLYIASTEGVSGKTLIALGLSTIWREEGVSVGYVKPLGKMPVMESGKVVDEDAMFLARELRLPGTPEEICPAVITQDLVMASYRREPLRLRERLEQAVRKASAGIDVLLIGGAANLRDGMFLGLPPMEIIASFDCRVLLVDRFDGERSMDQILWATGLLGDRLVGVVLNRVAPARASFVHEVVRPYFEAAGIRLFGAIPADPLMDSVSVSALAGALSASVECGNDRLETMVERFCAGAMDVESALRRFRRLPRKAVVTGGTRADIQHAALETDTRCLVLTGGVPPGDQILHRAGELGIPILVTTEDTMTALKRCEELLGRLRIRERGKIERGIRLVREHVDAAGILESLGSGRRRGK
jgi:uncharacterized protein